MAYDKFNNYELVGILRNPAVCKKFKNAMSLRERAADVIEELEGQIAKMKAQLPKSKSTSPYDTSTKRHPPTRTVRSLNPYTGQVTEHKIVD